MEAAETRQLIDYATAMQLTGLQRRTFFNRLKQGQVAIFVDPTDRRKRWLDRRDVLRLARTQEAERGETAA
jgi:hypothetical protein